MLVVLKDVGVITLRLLSSQVKSLFFFAFMLEPPPVVGFICCFSLKQERSVATALGVEE